MTYAHLFSPSEKMLPFHKGFLISIRSLQGLNAKLEARDYSYLMSAMCYQENLIFFFCTRFWQILWPPFSNSCQPNNKVSTSESQLKNPHYLGNCSEEKMTILSTDIVLNLENENPNELDEQSTVCTLKDDMSGEDELLLYVYRIICNRKLIIMKVTFIRYQEKFMI